MADHVVLGSRSSATSGAASPGSSPTSPAGRSTACISAVTSWVMSGVLALIEAVWSVIDNTTRLQAERRMVLVDRDSPVAMALAIGVVGDRR